VNECCLIPIVPASAISWREQETFRCFLIGDRSFSTRGTHRVTLVTDNRYLVIKEERRTVVLFQLNTDAVTMTYIL